MNIKAGVVVIAALALGVSACSETNDSASMNNGVSDLAMQGGELASQLELEITEYVDSPSCDKLYRMQAETDKLQMLTIKIAAAGGDDLSDDVSVANGYIEQEMSNQGC